MAGENSSPALGTDALAEGAEALGAATGTAGAAAAALAGAVVADRILDVLGAGAVPDWTTAPRKLSGHSLFRTGVLERGNDAAIQGRS